MKKSLLILISIIFISCEKDEKKSAGIAYDMAGTWNVVVQDNHNNINRYCTVQLNALSPTRALMKYGGCNGTQSPFCSPNDTIDFNTDGTLEIGPDTFYVFNARVIHIANGTYTENSMLMPLYKYWYKSGIDNNLYTYGYQFTR